VRRQGRETSSPTFEGMKAADIEKPIVFFFRTLPLDLFLKSTLKSLKSTLKCATEKERPN
jgi:hypothetical protein